MMPKGGDGFRMTIPTGVEDLPLDPTGDLVPDPSDRLCPLFVLYSSLAFLKCLAFVYKPIT